MFIHFLYLYYYIIFIIFIISRLVIISIHSVGYISNFNQSKSAFSFLAWGWFLRPSVNDDLPI